MQLLEVPNTFTDMTASVSMTGITILKDNKFKSRISGSNKIIHHPGKGIILKSQDTDEIQRLKLIKAKKKPTVKKAIKREGSVTKQKQFIVNKKEVVHRIRGFLNQQKGEKQLYFWTVTFPLQTSDDTCFILFNKWLTRLRKESMLKSYLWVSERQENGTLHYHIAIPHKMDIKKSNRYMRACIFTCIDNREINFSRLEAKNYNGVDISKDRKTRRVTNFAKQKKEKSLSNYLTKYISKNSESYTHLAWHCSRDYSNILIAYRVTNKEYITFQLGIFVSEEKVYENEWCKFFKWKTKPPPKVLQYLALINQTAQALLN